MVFPVSDLQWFKSDLQWYKSRDCLDNNIIVFVITLIRDDKTVVSIIIPPEEILTLTLVSQFLG